jgi:hypothetical protein
MARRLCIGDGYDAITMRATTQSRQRRRCLRIDGNDSFAPSPLSFVINFVAHRAIKIVIDDVVCRTIV